MKRILAILVLALSIIGLGQINSYAFTQTFTTVPSDGLNHDKYYTWGINWTVPTGNTITGATLTYNNIYDWTHETDTLYTNLLNTATVGWTTGNDTQNGNKFSGTNVLLLGSWDDPHGDSSHKINLPYTIPADHYSWLKDGNFGIGIDPDCHYYLSSIQLDINYAPTATPEPASMTLLGLGLLGIWKFGRKKHA